MGKGYGIVRLDLLDGHVYHYDIEQDTENGLLVEIDYVKGTVAPTTDPSKDQVLLASTVKMYDDSVDESDFINKVGSFKVRTYELVKGDFFTTTQLDFSGERTSIDTIVKGDYAYPVVGGKLAFGTAVPSSKQYFRVEEVTALNGYPAVAVHVEKAV